MGARRAAVVERHYISRTSKSLRAPPLTYIRAHGLIVDVRCDQHDQITVYVVTVK
jgi:hypothetical protein